MFINSLKYNKNIFFRKSSNVFFQKKKLNLNFFIYNCIDKKPLINLVYSKENIISNFTFFKSFNFIKKTDLHLWWLYKNNKNNNFQFIPNLFQFTKLQVILNFNLKKIIYKASCGNFSIFLNSNFLKNRNKLKYPSSKLQILPFFLFSFYNRKEDFFKRKNRLRFFKYKQKITVRGIAQNPNDHPNGGRSKVKKPFLNKFFKIAKCSK